MKRNGILLVTILFGLYLLFGSASAFAADKFTPKPSKWGPADEIGNCNYLTPAKVLEGLSTIKTGKVYDMGCEYYKDFPAYPPRNVWIWLLTHGVTVDPPRGYDKGTDMEEFVCMSTGVSTQLDGFAHVGSNHVFYNATPQSAIINPAGAMKFGMEKVPPILTRGVLVDIPRFKGRDLGPTEEISLADFKACLKKEGVELRQGDALIVHTGWMERYLDKDNKTFGSSNPGIVEDIAWYLVEKGIVGIGTDQWCTEAFPHPGFPKDLYNSGFVPCHCILLGNGIHLFQNVKTEALAKACAQDGKYEFFFAFTHPKLKGTVQGIGQPVAVK